MSGTHANPPTERADRTETSESHASWSTSAGISVSGRVIPSLAEALANPKRHGAARTIPYRGPLSRLGYCMPHRIRCCPRHIIGLPAPAPRPDAISGEQPIVRVSYPAHLFLEGPDRPPVQAGPITPARAPYMNGFAGDSRRHPAALTAYMTPRTRRCPPRWSGRRTDQPLLGARGALSFGGERGWVGGWVGGADDLSRDGTPLSRRATERPATFPPGDVDTISPLSSWPFNLVLRPAQAVGYHHPPPPARPGTTRCYRP